MAVNSRWLNFFSVMVDRFPVYYFSAIQGYGFYGYPVGFVERGSGHYSCKSA